MWLVVFVVDVFFSVKDTYRADVYKRSNVGCFRVIGMRLAVFHVGQRRQVHDVVWPDLFEVLFHLRLVTNVAMGKPRFVEVNVSRKHVCITCKSFVHTLAEHAAATCDQDSVSLPYHPDYNSPNLNLSISMIVGTTTESLEPLARPACRWKCVTGNCAIRNPALRARISISASIKALVPLMVMASKTFRL